MVVTYFGEGCLRLQSGELSLLIDSTNNRLKGDVVVKTLTPAHVTSVAANEILFPGEYEVRGLEIRGWEVASESSEKFVKTVYRIDWEDISFALLGHLSKPPTPDLLEKLGEPDVLVLPVGAGHFLGPDAAASVVKKLEPRIVIPIFFSSAKDFLGALGQKAEAQDKFVFKKKDILQGVGKAVVLQNAG